MLTWAVMWSKQNYIYELDYFCFYSVYAKNNLEKEYRNIWKQITNQPIFSLIICTHASCPFGTVSSAKQTGTVNNILRLFLPFCLLYSESSLDVAGTDTANFQHVYCYLADIAMEVGRGRWEDEWFYGFTYIPSESIYQLLQIWAALKMLWPTFESFGWGRYPNYRNKVWPLGCILAQSAQCQQHSIIKLNY